QACGASEWSDRPRGVWRWYDADGFESLLVFDFERTADTERQFAGRRSVAYDAGKSNAAWRQRDRDGGLGPEYCFGHGKKEPTRCYGDYTRTCRGRFPGKDSDRSVSEGLPDCRGPTDKFAANSSGCRNGERHQIGRAES